ncbi:hypothetical protein R1sor_011833 [Riccia sorocarpa]|uniref:DUF4283 domain-containing protein n=1 Tax=Riccia sorocarpa TaxID=122646 RepID=A0ABD3I208_9MARC
MIQLSQWTPAYNYKEASLASKQVWVKLPFVDPMIVDHSYKMLAKLGPVLFYAVVRTNVAEMSLLLKYQHLPPAYIDPDLIPPALPFPPKLTTLGRDPRESKKVSNEKAVTAATLVT